MGRLETNHRKKLQEVLMNASWRKNQATIQQLEKGIEVLTRSSTGDKDKDEETIQDLEGWLQGTRKSLADTERRLQ